MNIYRYSKDDNLYKLYYLRPHKIMGSWYEAEPLFQGRGELITGLSEGDLKEFSFVAGDFARIPVCTPQQDGAKPGAPESGSFKSGSRIKSKRFLVEFPYSVEEFLEEYGELEMDKPPSQSDYVAWGKASFQHHLQKVILDKGVEGIKIRTEGKH